MLHPFAGLLPGRPTELSDNHDLEGVAAGMQKGGGNGGSGQKPGTATTLAFPEEGSGKPGVTTRALGEE